MEKGGFRYKALDFFVIQKKLVIDATARMRNGCGSNASGGAAIDRSRATPGVMTARRDAGVGDADLARGRAWVTASENWQHQ